jgi:hypothetical protein
MGVFLILLNQISLKIRRDFAKDNPKKLKYSNVNININKYNEREKNNKNNYDCRTNHL